MSRAYLLVEGQTEETFVRELLQPHYARMGLYLTPILVSTSRGHQGGVVSYAKVRPQIEHLCKQVAYAYVSTMFAHGQTRIRISMGRLGSLAIPLPPIGLQRDFTQQAAAMQTLKTGHRACLGELDPLFASLQHRAFRGDL